MKLCPRCQNELYDDAYIIDQSKNLSDYILVKRNKDYTKEKYPLRAYLCEHCGYVELYAFKRDTK